MINIIPAIDIIEGKCVRLFQGDYNQKKIYESDPLEVAKRFEYAGLKRLHLVDLEGAKHGNLMNLNVLQTLASKTKLTIDFGGGIKTDADIEKVFNAGAAIITVGSLAVSNKLLVLDWIKKYGPDKIIIAADSKNGQIAIGGWLETTSLSVKEFIAAYQKAGASLFLCTDISKDGMMQGAALGLYKDLRNAIPAARVIASGGITTTKEIEQLNKMGVDSVIIGKAYYEGLITLESLNKWL